MKIRKITNHVVRRYKERVVFDTKRNSRSDNEIRKLIYRAVLEQFPDYFLEYIAGVSDRLCFS